MSIPTLSMGAPTLGFFRRSRAANSAVHDRIWPSFELIQDFMVVLVTCKNEEDPIKNDGASTVFTTIYIHFSDAQWQITGVGGGFWSKFELIRAIMHILVTCQNEVDSIKTLGLEWSKYFSHYKSM